MSNAKTKFGFVQVCSFVASANGVVDMDTTKDGLLLNGKTFVGSINGLYFDCTAIEVCTNGIVLLNVAQQCQLAKQYKTSSKADMCGFAYNQISSFVVDDMEDD